MDPAFQRDSRIDRIRALAICLVLFWHLQPLPIPPADASMGISRWLGWGIEQFYLQISLLAVPMFYLVSLYLLFEKLDTQGHCYLTRRCPRVLGLYLFWTGCQFIAWFLSWRMLPGGHEVSLGAMSIYRLIAEGGPPLPMAGGSVFYFLFVLLVLVLISVGFLRLKKCGPLFYITAAATTALSLLYFEAANLTGGVVPYWRLDNFILYVPIGYALWRYDAKKWRQVLPYLYVGFVLFSIQDIWLRGHGAYGGAYSRISIVMGAAALVGTLWQGRRFGKSRLAVFFSTYSLGIFALHKYWLLGCLALFPAMGGATRFAVPAIRAAIVVSLTLLTVYFAGHTGLKRVLR